MIAPIKVTGGKKESANMRKLVFNASQNQCISPTQKRMTANKIPKPVKVVNILFTCELLLDYNEQQDRLMSAPLHSSVDGVFLKRYIVV